MACLTMAVDCGSVTRCDFASPKALATKPGPPWSLDVAAAKDGRAPAPILYRFSPMANVLIPGSVKPNPTHQPHQPGESQLAPATAGSGQPRAEAQPGIGETTRGPSQRLLGVFLVGMTCIAYLGLTHTPATE